MKRVLMKSNTRGLPFGFLWWVPLLGICTAWAPGVCGGQGGEEFAQWVLGLWAPTPFYPGSNRMGNLIPLLASGIRNVIWNANAQIIVRSFLSFMAVYYACRLLARNRPPAEREPAAAFVFFCIPLLLIAQFTGPGFVTFWVSNHTYLLALSIMLPSFHYLRKAPGAGRLAAGGIGLTIAFWVNLAAYLLAVFYLAALAIAILWRTWPRIVGRLRDGRRRWSLEPLRRILVISAIASVGFMMADAAGVLYARWFPALNQSFAATNYIGVELALSHIPNAVQNLAQQAGGPILMAEFLLCCAMVTLRFRFAGLSFPRHFTPFTNRRTELALLTAAVAYLLVVSQTVHVANNAMNFRYFLFTAGTIVFLTSSYLYGFCRWMLATAAPKRRAAAMSGIVLGLLPGICIGAVAARYGFPRNYCAFEESLGQYDTEAHFATAGQYAGVIGSYWDVWPVIFDAAILADQGKADLQAIFPVTFRGELVGAGLRRRVRRDLERDGVARVLCLVPSPDRLEHTDCMGLLRWPDAAHRISGAGAVNAAVPLAFPPNSEEIDIHPPVLSPGETVRFSTGGDAVRYEFDGWWTPEGFGSWTSGHEAELFFALAKIPEHEMVLDFKVVADIGKFVNPSRAVSVAVLVNGHHAGEWFFNPDSGDRILRISHLWLRVAGANFVTFRIYSPHSGRELGFSPTDQRQLGFAVSSMRWLESAVGSVDSRAAH